MPLKDSTETKTGCQERRGGDRIRTCSLQVMSLMSWPIPLLKSKFWQDNRSNNWSRGSIDEDIIFLQQTHKKISLSNELSRTSFHLPTLQGCLAYPTRSGYPTQILGERVVYRINQLEHELNIAVRWQPGNTSEKIYGKSQPPICY